MGRQRQGKGGGYRRAQGTFGFSITLAEFIVVAFPSHWQV